MCRQSESVVDVEHITDEVDHLARGLFNGVVNAVDHYK